VSTKTKKIGLSIVAFLLVLVLAELVLRQLSPATLGFSYANGKFLPPKEFTYAKSANSLGFHDVEHGGKPDGAKRVLLIGDSYVAAHYVTVPEGVGQRFQYHLNSNSDRTFEVVACGKPGWGPREQLDCLNQFAPQIQPDLVVQLFLPFNDVRDCSDELRAESKQQIRQMNRFRPGWGHYDAEQAPAFWLRFSVLNQLLSHRLALMSAPEGIDQIPVDYFVYAEHPTAVWRQAWENAENILHEMHATARQAGAKYVLVSASTPHGVRGSEEGLRYLARAYPEMQKLAWDLDGPNERLALFCRAHGIRFVSLEPIFRQLTQQEGRKLHFRYDGHWTAEGNDLAGRLMADFILRAE
jgi:hypothetical protein